MSIESFYIICGVLVIECVLVSIYWGGYLYYKLTYPRYYVIQPGTEIHNFFNGNKGVPPLFRVRMEHGRLIFEEYYNGWYQYCHHYDIFADKLDDPHYFRRVTNEERALII